MSARPRAGPLAAATPLPGAGILVVDDEPSVISALARVLGRHGHRIERARSGAEALSVLESGSIEIVISDMRMPGMSGAELLARVSGRWPEVVRILITGHADLEATVEAINRGHIFRYIAKPWNEGDLLAAVRDGIAHRERFVERSSLLATIRERTSELTKRHRVDTVRILATMAETRRGAPPESSRTMAETAYRVASAMGLGEAPAQDVLFASFLQDIGMIAIPDGLVSRPASALTREERSEVARHPVLGEALIGALSSLGEVARIIRSHHEHFDGTGYPDGLAGEAIPLGARIIAVVGDYERVREGRLLLDSLSDGEARAYMRAHRGTRYDPEVVDCFLALPEHRTGRNREAMLPANDLRPGMQLARDVVGRNGTVLAPKGSVLDEATIGLIRDAAGAAGAAMRICVLEIRDEGPG